MKVAPMKLVIKRHLAKDVYEMTLQGDISEAITSPGQFVHVQTGSDSELLRRPISIASYNLEQALCTIIFRVDGKGTARLAGLKEGATLDVLGPLGNGFSLNRAIEKGKAILVGGGIGVPPLYGLSQALTAVGVEVEHILGFMTKDAVFYEELFSKLGNTQVTTDDGTHGYHGRVTDLMNKDSGNDTVIYTCGPTPMLRALNNRYGHQDLYLSLEQRMGCGVGACFACVTAVTDPDDDRGYRKICSDGPVFKGNEVTL